MADVEMHGASQVTRQENVPLGMADVTGIKVRQRTTTNTEQSKT